MCPEGIGHDETHRPSTLNAAQIDSKSGDGFFSMNNLGCGDPGPPRVRRSF